MSGSRKNLVIVGAAVAALMVATVLVGGYVNVSSGEFQTGSQSKACQATGQMAWCFAQNTPRQSDKGCCPAQNTPGGSDVGCCPTQNSPGESDTGCCPGKCCPAECCPDECDKCCCPAECCPKRLGGACCAEEATSCCG